MYRQETRSSLVRIVLTILALFMLLSLASVHATEIANAVEVMAVRTGGLTNDAGQGSTGGNTSGVIDEIKHNMANAPKGYRFYAIDSDGTQVGTRVDLWYGQGTIDKVRALTKEAIGMDYSCYPTDCRVTGDWKYSRWGKPLETLLNENGDNEIPEPFIGQSPNGIALKAWMNTVAEGAELVNGLRLIRELFGSDAYKTYIEDNTGDKQLYIIIETLTLFDIVNDRREVVGVFAGSAYNWAKLSKYDLKMDYGHAQLRRFSNGVLPLSLVLTEDEEDALWKITNRLEHMHLPSDLSAGGDANTASNWISNDLMLSHGYGVHAYTFGDLFIHTTHTWDYPLGNTPGPAPKEPEEKKDKVNILKIYYTEDPKTGELLEWQGSYLRNDTPRNIDIEDEDEYKVREWKTTNVQIAGADGPVPHKWEWVDPWTPIQGPSGGPGTVNMNPDKPDYEYTLVVLLTKTEEEELESELIIEESEISIYRKISEVSDFNLSDTKIESVPKVPNIRDKV